MLPLTIAFLASLALHHEESPQSSRRVETSRAAKLDLPLPDEKDAFVFVVFGDRTGGPASGIRVLEQAVADTNLLAPDLVMTVGDLVQGYNDTPKWLEQASEYKSVMAKLVCPWFPVAGNHDVYWRGKGAKPAGEHEANFEAHFGPLWYSFEHKKSVFIALFSDEGDPATGRKSFDEPACQKMSDAQFEWLRGTLDRSKQAEHVFLFLHHPRWLAGRYGDDWARVHALLAAAGNVSAVFAGHIHHMRYDGKKDGIEYFALATVGGEQEGFAKEAGYLHQFHVVTVRKDRLALASLPVGTVQDPRVITGAISDEVAALAKALPTRVEGRIELRADGGGGPLAIALRNPTSRRIEVEVTGRSDDSRWVFEPDHVHARLAPGESKRVELRAARPSNESGPLDRALRAPELRLGVDYLGEGLRVPLPLRTLEAELVLALEAAELPAGTPNGALVLDGKSARLTARLDLRDGPFTLEGWLRADGEFKGRAGFLCKTEQSDYGLFVDGGKPSFSVFLGGKYARAQCTEPLLEVGKWAHVAGVFDGSELRLYVDGRLCARERASGARKKNALPLVVGADVKGDGTSESFFQGRIDEVRVSTIARYAGEEFVPAIRFEHDMSTVLLLHLDAAIALWTPDESLGAAHALLDGAARFEAR